MGKKMTVTFGIPFGGRSAFVDWDRTVFHLNATIASIYGQLDPNFRIIVACTDLPGLSISTDDRLEFLYCAQAEEVTFAGLNTDGGRKRHRIAQRARELGGGYLMLADADDLMSNQLVLLCCAMAIRMDMWLDAVTRWMR